MLLFTFLSGYFSPLFRLSFFAPFLIITYYQKSYLGSLKSSFFCGVILDLLSSPLRFGVWTLNFLTTTTLLYPQKRNFFADSMMTLPLLVFFFSVVSTLVQLFLLFIFSKPFPISLPWIFTDLIFMPLLDSLFSFFWFIVPHFFFNFGIKRMVK